MKEFQEQQGDDADKATNVDLQIGSVVGGGIRDQVSVFYVVEGIFNLLGVLVVIKDGLGGSMREGSKEDLLSKAGLLESHF